MITKLGDGVAQWLVLSPHSKKVSDNLEHSDDVTFGARTLWKELLQAHGALLDPKLDLSSLAKVTDGYAQGHILQAIQTILIPHRLELQAKRPLTAVEFIPPLARQDPVYKEEEESFKAWYSRTPLGKKRARAAKASEEQAILKKGKTKGGKLQKKGKEGKKKKKKKK